MSTKIMTISPGLAKDYDATSTYAVGEYVLHQNAYWKCTTAIQVAEAWTPAHWQKDEEPIEHIQGELKDRPTKAQIDAGWWGDWHLSSDDDNIDLGAYGIEWGENPNDSSIEGWRLIVGGIPYVFVAGNQDDVRVVFESIPPNGASAVAIRSRIASPVPTATSQLLNDSGFITQQDNKLDGAAAYPVWDDTQEAWAAGTIVSWQGKLYRTANGTSNPVAIPGTAAGASVWSEVTIQQLLAEKQNTLSFDNAPTQDSNNPVKSGGVYAALQNKAGLDDLNYVLTTPGEWDYISEVFTPDYQNGKWGFALPEGFGQDNFGIDSDFLPSSETDPNATSFSVDVMGSIHTVTRSTAPGYLSDRAVNKIIQGGALTFPAAVKGRSRDFLIEVPADNSGQITISSTDAAGVSVSLTETPTITSGSVIRFTEVAQTISDEAVTAASFSAVNLTATSISMADIRYDIVTVTMSDDWKFEGLPDDTDHTATTDYTVTSQGVVWRLYLDGASSPSTSTSTLNNPYTANSTYLEYADLSYGSPVQTYYVKAYRLFDLQDRASNSVTASARMILRFPEKITGKVRDFTLRITLTGSGSIEIFDDDSGGDSITILGQPIFRDGMVIRFTEVAQGIFSVTATTATKTSDLVNDGPPASDTNHGNLYATVNQIPAAYTDLPKEDGADGYDGESGHSNGFAGSLGYWAKGDHIHPHDSTKADNTRLYPTWQNNVAYSEGDIVVDPTNKKIYRAKSSVAASSQVPSTLSTSWSLAGIPTIQSQIAAKYTVPSGGIPLADLTDSLRATINGAVPASNIKRLSDQILNGELADGLDVKLALKDKAEKQEVTVKRDLDDLIVTGAPAAADSWFIVDIYNPNGTKISRDTLEWSNGAWATTPTKLTIAASNGVGNYSLQMKNITGFVGGTAFQLNAHHMATITYSTSDPDDIFGEGSLIGTYTFMIYSVVDTLLKKSEGMEMLNGAEINLKSIDDLYAFAEQLVVLLGGVPNT